MFGNINSSSYYRANPYYQQGYLPDTAFKNRKQPSYMVELPQGDNAFDPTNKKHFQRLGYYSTIGNEHIMDPDPVGSPAREKTYFRNLNVDDIEGSSTNTLISKAVKNKLKAKEYLAAREREQRQAQMQLKMRNIERTEDQRKRLQALSKINRGNQPNYHEKIMKMRTEQSQKQSPPPVHTKERSSIQQPPLPPHTHGTHGHQKSHYELELERTQQEIRQLQEQLKAERHEIPTNQTYNYHQSSSYRGKVPEYEHEKYEEMRKSIPQPYRRQEEYPQTFRRQPPPENPPSNSTQRQSGQNSNEIGSPLIPQVQNQQLDDYRRQYDPYNKNRSLTDHVHSNGYEPPYMRKQSRQVNSQRNIETPIYDQRNQVRQTREQHRRINPTYLSYGSASIGLAGRNIIGY